jgi:HAD superfamily hydrolase (TIGR01509 family)
LDDSFTTWQAFKEYFSLYGRTLSFQAFKKEFCLPCHTFLAKMKIPESAIPEFTKIFNPLYLKSMSYVKLFPEVKETLRILKETGVKIGLVSATPKELLYASVKKFGLREYFETIICNADKPSPKPIQQACEEISIRPDERVVYVGDMEEDIISAKRAGAISIGLCRTNGSYNDRIKLQAQNPNYIVSDLRELLGLDIW